MRIATVLLLSLALAAPAHATDQALEAMVQAERDFAAMSVARGHVPAFRQFMAADSVMYRPGPVSGRAWYEKAPENREIVLDWVPEFAEIAASGDMGYTTGPWQLRPAGDDKAEPSCGHFFSVWQRGEDGRFYNIVDHGMDHGFQALGSSVTRRGNGHNKEPVTLPAATLAIRQHALLGDDRELVRKLTEAGGATAWRAAANADVLVLRPGSPPAIGPGKSGAMASLPAMDLAVLRISAAGDLGVTSGYGGDAAKPHVYIRVWRWVDGHWRIVADLLTT